MNYVDWLGNKVSESIRGTFLVDNSGKLQLRIPRGENIVFIASYIYSNPCCKVGDCRRALLQWRGIKVCDQSRGQYNSYFYDYWSYKWYHHKNWSKIKDSSGKQRLQLTSNGMGLVDLDLADKIQKATSQNEDRVRFIVPSNQKEFFVGQKYENMFPNKAKDCA